LYKGVIRINAKRREHAYITVDGLTSDIFIDGPVARNRAYDNDIVVWFSLCEFCEVLRSKRCE